MQQAPGLADLAYLAGAFASYSVLVWIILRALIKFDERAARSQRDIEAEPPQEQDESHRHRHVRKVMPADLDQRLR